MLLDNFIRLSCLGLTVYKLMRCLKAMPHDFLIALAFQRRVRLTFVCRLSALWLTDSFHAEAPLGGELGGRGGGGEGGGGGHSTKFYTGSSSPRSNPLPFYILFLTEKVPLSPGEGTPWVGRCGPALWPCLRQKSLIFLPCLRHLTRNHTLCKTIINIETLSHLSHGQSQNFLQLFKT